MSGPGAGFQSALITGAERKAHKRKAIKPYVVFKVLVGVW